MNTKLSLSVMMINLVSERLLLTLWVGTLCAIGYLAVPMAFSVFDANVAGAYAGKLFAVVNMLGLACGGVLLLAKMLLLGKQVIYLWRFWVIVLMVFMTVIMAGYLQPHIALIKQQLTGPALHHSPSFKQYHAWSEILYLVITLAGLALVVSQDRVR